MSNFLRSDSTNFSLAHVLLSICVFSLSILNYLLFGSVLAMLATSQLLSAHINIIYSILFYSVINKQVQCLDICVENRRLGLNTAVTVQFCK